MLVQTIMLKAKLCGRGHVHPVGLAHQCFFDFLFKCIPQVCEHGFLEFVVDMEADVMHDFLGAAHRR